MPSFTEIAPAQLMRRIGTPDAPLLLDVRLPEDVAADPRRLPTARAVPFDSAPDGLARGTRIVVYCRAGHAVSHAAAALLRAAGSEAEVLEGGIEGWAALGLPLIPAAALPPTHLWVTRHRPKIDRVACPWLIRRFVDPGARFLFVPPTEVSAVAAQTGAIPFDVEGVTFSHRGPLCTFDAMLDDWGLRTEALDRLSIVVRGADTDRHDLHPACAGLLALSVGMSRLWRDDLAQIEAALPIYDALYRWARDGFDEGHDWPATRA